MNENIMFQNQSHMFFKKDTLIFDLGITFLVLQTFGLWTLPLPPAYSEKISFYFL